MYYVRLASYFCNILQLPYSEKMIVSVYILIRKA